MGNSNQNLVPLQARLCTLIVLWCCSIILWQMVRPRPGLWLLPLKPAFKDFCEVLFSDAFAGVCEIDDGDSVLLGARKWPGRHPSVYVETH